MFDLKRAIEEWRRQMLAAGVKTPVPLEELESHLRDEIDRQMKCGRREAQAFESAAQLIGPAHEVEMEFQKVESTESERQRRRGQILAGTIFGLLQLILIGFVLFNSNMTFGQRMSGLAAIASSILLVATVGRLSYRYFPVIRAWRIRAAAFLISGVVPGLIWVLVVSYFLLMGQEFSFGEWLTALLWINCPPFAACLGLVWGIDIAAHEDAVIAGS